MVHTRSRTANKNKRKDPPPSTSDEEEGDVDVILVVRDAVVFHQINLQHNPHHYATGFHTAQRCAWMQRHCMNNQWLRNPGVYFNLVDSDHLKYGVVQREDLEQDLRHWSYLYLAGRLHKPVVHIDDLVVPNNDSITIPQLQRDCNLPAALSTALLLLSHQTTTAADEIDEHTVYQTIASLSYQGDPRMTVNAEDPQKVAKLVNNTERWRNLYGEATTQLQQAGVLSVVSSSSSDSNSWSWDANHPSAQKLLWQSLPVQVRRQCGYVNDDTAAALERLPTVLATAIVAPAARYQSFKGLWTAGLGKSAAYAYRKLSKGWK